MDDVLAHELLPTNVASVHIAKQVNQCSRGHQPSINFADKSERGIVRRGVSRSSHVVSYLRSSSRVYETASSDLVSSISSASAGKGGFSTISAIVEGSQQ